MATAKVWKAKNEFDGAPKLSDFYTVEEKLPPLKDNEILVEAVYMSIDPYFRLVNVVPDLPGEQVARVVESKAKDFPVGSLICAYAGWRTKTIIDVTKPLRFGVPISLTHDVAGHQPSVWLSAAGMPSITAYLAFTERCNPKAGEVVVVSAASGAVGSVVGQLAKARGLTVIGFAGSDEKCDLIKKLGFDHAFNYKKVKLADAISSVAPNGVDIYYDNVGGEISDAVYSKLRHGGRVLICGQIANYNKKDNKATDWNMAVLRLELTIRGFAIFSGGNVTEFARVRRELVPLIEKGKLKVQEHITNGFDKMPQAFLDLFTGANVGKSIVRI